MMSVMACCCEYAAYQVMTLSDTGEAETPAGGSVCIRCEDLALISCSETSVWGESYLEISHQAAASGSRHLEFCIYDLLEGRTLSRGARK